MEKLEQQRLAREQLASYEPWGRAGGGAPNPHGVRFTKIRNTGIYPEDELRGVSQYEPCRRWPSPRRRRRTPLRLREDPQLLYAETLRKSVDNDIRYRQTPDQQKCYKEILDDMVDKRKKALKDERRRNLDYERKMQTMDGPWGRPGPGGTSWRNPRDIGVNFSNSMGWTNNDCFNKMKGEHRRDKRSSLTLPRVKKADDSKEEEISEKENIKPSSVGKLPEIKQASPKESGAQDNHNKKNNDTKKEVQMKKDIQETYSSKRNGKKGKFIKRLPNGERIQKIVPDDDYDNKAEDGNGMDQKLTPEASILRLTGGIELVPLLSRRRRVGARTLPSSDVTRPPEQSCQWREVVQVDYLRDLKQQMQVKRERKQQCWNMQLDTVWTVRQPPELHAFYLSSRRFWKDSYRNVGGTLQRVCVYTMRRGRPCGGSQATAPPSEGAMRGATSHNYSTRRLLQTLLNNMWMQLARYKNGMGHKSPSVATTNEQANCETAPDEVDGRPH